MSQENVGTQAVEKKYSDEQLNNTLNNLKRVNPLICVLNFLPEEIRNILLSGHLNGVETLKNGVNEAARNVKQRSKLIEYGIPDGLWPMDKEITDEKGIDELEELGYKLFYKGKNADLYLIPGKNPIELLVYRTDRTSVFDIPLDLEVEGKGEIQNQIGLLGVEFAKSKGFDVANRELPENIPENLKARCQAVELCKPLTIEIDGKEKGLELILRNNLTGSLFRAYKEGKDPYGLKLSKGLEEWYHFDEPKFTPTTKEKNDTPIKSSLVQEAYPEIVEKLTQLFKDFTAFAREKGYIIIDAKFEIFINSQGKPVLGDEILTTESSRFIKIEDYENGEFKSADKEIVRQLGIEFKWREKFKALKEENPEAKILSVKDDITPNHKAEILSAYTGVFNALSDNKKYINTSKGPFAVSIGKHSDGYIEVFLDKDNNVRILEKTEEEALKSLIDIINNPPKNYLEKSPFLRELHGIETVDPSNGVFD